MTSFIFKVEKEDETARAGTITTSHGSIKTPVFMPVGTAGTVKAIFQKDLENLDIVKKQVLTERLVDKQKRMSTKGNSWQNLYPNEILTYKDWWQKFLAA